MGTVPTPLDWAGIAGNLATAAMLQAGVGDVLNFLLNPPGCQVRRTTVQSIPNTTPTAVSFDAEDLDNDTMHDPASNPTRITCNTPGRYLISGIYGCDPNATGQRELRIVKNATGTSISGARVITKPDGTIGSVVVSPTMEVSLVAGDFLEMYIVQTSGGALNTTAINGVFPILRARWVGP
jgi:hypothetical protein